jgi:hypothetical protein
VTTFARALLRTEVLELLAERPDLVAVADAVTSTQPRPRRRRRGGVVLAAGLAAALTVALWPGGSSPGFAERASAAIGSGPVLHVVVEAPARTTIVDLATGAETALRVRLEYRYDVERGRLRTTVSRGRRVTADVLQAPTGAYALLRPELDPALVGFVSGYREALDTTRPVEGVVDGRPVLWLEFGTGASHERVALDPQTLTPLFVESLVGSRVRWHVLEIRARDRRPGDFELPATRTPEPIRGSVVSSRTVTLSELAGERWHPVSVGAELEGLKLSAVEVERLVRAYARPAERTERGTGARLLYGRWPDAVELQQAPRPEPAYAYVGGGTFMGTAIPRRGRLVLTELRRTRWLGQLRAGSLFVTIWASSRSRVLAAARALEPIARKGR